MRDLEVKGDDLVIATHGRGFWVLDDVTPLRQVGADVARGSGLALRARSGGALPGVVVHRHALPKDEPRGPNPPAGAVIDYHLRAAAAAPVTLEIFDADGALVRRYSSADAVPAPDPAKDRMAPEWFVLPIGLSAAAGAYRFVWPLRYGAPPELSARGEGADPWAHGPWAPPGTYRLVLTVDGRRLEQPLEVRPDPRLFLPAAAYAEQLATARRIDGLRVVLAPAQREASRALSALGERIAKAPAAARADLEAARAKLQEATGQTGAWYLQPRRLDSLAAVRGTLDGLYDAVEGADAAPSADVHAGLAAVTPMVEQALAAWRDWNARERPALERRLREAGLPPLTLGEAPRPSEAGRTAAASSAGPVLRHVDHLAVGFEIHRLRGPELQAPRGELDDDPAATGAVADAGGADDPCADEAEASAIVDARDVFVRLEDRLLPLLPEPEPRIEEDLLPGPRARLEEDDLGGAVSLRVVGVDEELLDDPVLQAGDLEGLFME